MTRTLISFLGRNTAKPGGGYRKARYRFADGWERETPFFGLALAEKLQPSRIIILGTAGSMWDVLVEHLSQSEADLAIWQGLSEAAHSANVGADLLERARPLVEQRLGCSVDLQLIPYGEDDEQQIGILQTIAGANIKDRVTIDLTHGFRHLAALGLLSAFFLERMTRLEVEGLYYGALDMTRDGLTPVVRLDGLLAIQRWIDALDRFDQNGDYGVFADLLLEEGIPADKANCLKKAAFFERTFNLRDAARQLGTFLGVLDTELEGTGKLFQRQLMQRLSWARGNALHAQQRHLSFVYLQRRDFVRAAVFAWEAIITQECTRHGLDLDDFKENGDRKQAEAELKARLRAEGVRWPDAPQRRIKDLRNSLAHGSPPADWAPELRKALSDPDRLFNLMNTDMKASLS